MPDSNQMATLSEVLNKLAEKDLKEFALTERGMTIDNNRYYSADELTIIKTFWFEGVSDPSDMSVIYVLQTADGFKGYSMDAYGTYSEKEMGYNNFIRRIPEKGHDEQILFEL